MLTHSKHERLNEYMRKSCGDSSQQPKFQCSHFHNFTIDMRVIEQIILCNNIPLQPTTNIHSRHNGWHNLITFVKRNGKETHCENEHKWNLSKPTSVSEMKLHVGYCSNRVLNCKFKFNRLDFNSSTEFRLCKVHEAESTFKTSIQDDGAYIPPQFDNWK